MLPIRLGVLRALVKEISVSGASDKPLVVGGARELAAVLRKELGRGAKPGAVRADDEPKGGAVYVYVLGRDPTEADEAALKRARRARVPIVAVAAGPCPTTSRSRTCSRPTCCSSEPGRASRSRRSRF